MSGKPLQTLGNIEGAGHHRILVAERLQLQLLAMAAASVTGAAGFCGTSFVNLSTWP